MVAGTVTVLIRVGKLECPPWIDKTGCALVSSLEYWLFLCTCLQSWVSRIVILIYALCLPSDFSRVLSTAFSLVISVSINLSAHLPLMLSHVFFLTSAASFSAFLCGWSAMVELMLVLHECCLRRSHLHLRSQLRSSLNVLRHFA